MKLLIACLVIMLAALQLRLWAGDGGLVQYWRMRAQLDAQQAEMAQLQQRNRQLAAEVLDLQTGTRAIEERARSELGMVGPGETFYQLVEPVAQQ